MCLSADDKDGKRTKGAKAIPNVHPANSLILPDGKIFKVQKKRQRKIYSCIPCHQRKIKCSREAPTCDNCLKLADKNPQDRDAILEACKYFDNDKKKNLKKRGVKLELHNQVVQDQPTSQNPTKSPESVDSTPASNPNTAGDEPNQFDENIRDTLGSGYPTTSSNSQMYETDYTNQNYDHGRGNFQFDNNDLVYKPRDDSITQVMNSLAPLVSNLDTDLNAYNNNNNNIENTNTNASPTEGANHDENTDTNPVYGNNHYYNPPLYTQLPNTASDTPACADNRMNNTSSEQHLHSHYSRQFTTPFVPILADLPTKERSDELLKAFQTNIHSILPILDMPNFTEQYNEFWYCGLFLTENIEKLYEYHVYHKDKPFDQYPEKISDFLYWYNKTKCSLNPANFAEFLILLFAVYYTSVSSSVYELLSSSNFLSYKNEVNKYYNTFKKMNYKGLDNPRVMSLAVLQINVLVQSITNLKSGKSLINISKILRICQFYQLNRDPVMYHALKDTHLVQTRRIVWWEIFHLDNMVSFFLNLTPSIKLTDFDTSLLVETLDDDSSSRFAIMYLNCLFRFALIVDDLNGLTNGLNTQMKFEDIDRLKTNISNLFITCASTMRKMNDLYDSQKQSSTSIAETNVIEFKNPIITYQHNANMKSPYAGSAAEFDPQSNADPNHSLETSPDCFKFFMNLLNTLSDKILIMLQKKILLNPYIITDTFQIDSNLDLRLTTIDYNYTDLQSNLLPSLLHYLDSFLLLSKKDMMKFNWKLKSYIPIDELILLLQILAANYRAGLSQDEIGPIIDLNLKIYLADQTINSLRLNWHNKLSSVNKLISLTSSLWELMILKYNINLRLSYSMFDKFKFPKPNYDCPNLRTADKQVSMNSDPNYKPLSSISCSEISPRSIGVASAGNVHLGHTQLGINRSLFGDRPVFPKVNTQGSGIKVEDDSKDGLGSVSTKEKFIRIAREIEDELLKEGNTGFIQDTDDDEEGWYNLGTEEEYGYNSIDDFHFFKNLKSDVIRLFKSIVS